MKFRIVVRRAGRPEALLEQQFAVDAGRPFAFGRGPDNDLVLADPDKKVSTRHGRIELREDGQLHAIDLGSTNGTYHRGQAVDGEAGVILDDGDVLQIGDFAMQLLLLSGVSRPGGAPGQDFEATIYSFDPRAAAADTHRRLEQLYALHAAKGHDARMAALQQALQDAMDGLTPQQARAVLMNLRLEFGAGAVEVAGSSEGVGAAQEELYKAGYDGLRSLAHRFLPDGQFTSADQVRRFTESLQRFAEVALSWVSRQLQGRAAFEDEFGAEVTMAFQRSANPLKGQTADNMGAYLFDWSNPEAEDAKTHYLEAVFKDLAEHQLGLLAGVREAIGAVVDRIAPDKVMAELEGGGFSLSSKSARAWENYEKLYRDLLEERSKLFNDVISPAVQRGYLQQHDRSQGGGEPPQPTRPEDQS